jgi:hypothetical protein
MLIGEADEGHAAAWRRVSDNELHTMQTRDSRNQRETKASARHVAALFDAVEAACNRLVFLAWDARAGVADLHADPAHV